MPSRRASRRPPLGGRWFAAAHARSWVHAGPGCKQARSGGSCCAAGPCAMDTRPTESGWQWQPGKPAHFSLALKSDRRSTSQLQLVVLCVVW